MRISAITTMLIGLSATPALAQAPTWSRGIQDLPIAHDECMRRADRALQAEGYYVETRGGGYTAANKAVHSAVIMCNDAPGGKSWVNIVVASNDPRRDGGVPGLEREKLQRQMAQVGPTGVVATPGKTMSPEVINYTSWDGSKWSARLQGNNFMHAPNGDWSRAHSDVIINYISWDGGRWTARLQDGRFLHAPNGDFGRAHADVILNYISWDNAKLTVRVQ